jgi:hypothetical protein
MYAPGLLDGLKPALRHLVLMLIATGLAWLGADLVPFLQGEGGVLATLAAPFVTLLVAYLTPLTKQYGSGSEDA